MKKKRREYQGTKANQKYTQDIRSHYIQTTNNTANKLDDKSQKLSLLQTERNFTSFKGYFLDLT